MQKTKLNFGQAVEALKSGQRVSREGWNGKGMFLFYVDSWEYGVNTEYAKQPFIAMKTAQNMVVPWLASQSDVLGEDWCIVD